MYNFELWLATLFEDFLNSSVRGDVVDQVTSYSDEDAEIW